MNLLICFETCPTPKLLKHVRLLAFTYKAIQLVPIDSYSSRSIIYTNTPLPPFRPSFILDKLFIE